jgi:hypothetical protein
MNDDLHRFLDGEGSLEGLSKQNQPEAEAWDRMLDDFRTGMGSAPPPPWLEQSVMAEIETLSEPGALRRMASWLLTPRPIRVSPAVAGLAAAVVAILILFRGGTEPAGIPGADQAGMAERVVYVQFTLEAPGAQSVSVAGDFEGWAGSHTLEDVDGDGVWTGRIPLNPGVHAYMFVVDETDWITDPQAQRYADDGFGNRNAILAVAAPST